MFSLIKIQELTQLVDEIGAENWLIIAVPDLSNPSGFSTYKVLAQDFVNTNIVHFLNPDNQFLISNTPLILGGFDVPRSQLTIDDSGYNYGVGVQDLSLLGGGFEAAIAAVDLNTGTGFVIKVTNSMIEIKHLLNGVTTTSITLTDGNINVTGLPTSSAGLSAGDLWNDSGTMKII